jgi:hypothetical protein
MFETDCRKSNSGGGLLEKYMRFKELRQCALELNESACEITERNAITQLVETMWNAPFQNTRIQMTPWKLKSESFPLRSEMPEPEKMVEVPIHRPESDKDLLPEFHDSGRNCISLDENLLLIQFIHRMKNGEINEHDEEYISVKSLCRFLNYVIQSYKSGLDCESLGYCWNYKEGCTAVFYPEEIRYAMTKLKCTTELKLLDEYEKLFNEKFQNGSTVR